MRPNSWLTQLKQNTAVALSVVASVRPERIEQAAIEQKKLYDRLDSLHRSEKFFAGEKYKGEDRDKYLKPIRLEIEEVENKIAVSYPVKTIGDLNREDPETLIDCMKLLVNDLRLFFQVDNMINNKGIETLCPLIIAKYRSFTLEEIAICFNEAKEGEHGKAFNRLDGAMIMLWLKKAAEEKALRQRERNYAFEVNVKAGAGEDRTAYQDNSKLLLEAQLAVMKERAKSRKVSNR